MEHIIERRRVRRALEAAVLSTVIQHDTRTGQATLLELAQHFESVLRNCGYELTERPRTVYSEPYVLSAELRT